MAWSSTKLRYLSQLFLFQTCCLINNRLLICHMTEDLLKPLISRKAHVSPPVRCDRLFSSRSSCVTRGPQWTKEIIMAVIKHLHTRVTEKKTEIGGRFLISVPCFNPTMLSNVNVFIMMLFLKLNMTCWRSFFFNIFQSYDFNHLFYFQNADFCFLKKHLFIITDLLT